MTLDIIKAFIIFREHIILRADIFGVLGASAIPLCSLPCRSYRQVRQISPVFEPVQSAT